MLYDLHAVTDNIGDKFAAWSYYHALLKVTCRHALYGLTIKLVSRHAAVIGPITQDAMANLTKPGMYHATCAVTHAIHLGLQGKRVMLTVESLSFASTQCHWARP